MLHLFWLYFFLFLFITVSSIVLFTFWVWLFLSRFNIIITVSFVVLHMFWIYFLLLGFNQVIMINFWSCFAFLVRFIFCFYHTQLNFFHKSFLVLNISFSIHFGIFTFQHSILFYFFLLSVLRFWSCFPKSTCLGIVGFWNINFNDLPKQLPLNLIFHQWFNSI